jgi:alpha-mannosidase
MGTHRFTYVLLPHYGPYNYAGVVQASYALNAPLRSAFLEPSAGISGALPPFLHCDDRNIVIETAKKSEDGGDLIVRLYECHNGRGVAELACVCEPKQAWLCDMEETPLAEMEITDGAIRFDYKPFEIITIRIRS